MSSISGISVRICSCAGLMTIGAIARSQEATTAENVNEDFVAFARCEG